MRYWLAFWALGFIWGSSFLLIKIGVEELAVFQLVAIRVTLASVLFVLFLLATRRYPPRQIADLASIGVVGFFNVALPFSLITAAEQQIDSSLATILNSTVPLFGLVIAHFVLLDEKLTRAKFAGLLTGYVGVMVLASRGLSDTGNSPLEGQAMMLGAALSYACAIVFMRLRLRHIDPLVIAGFSLTVGAVVVLPLAMLTDGMPNPSELETRTIVAVLTLSIINTVIAYFLFYSLIAAWGTRSTMVTYTFPPIGISLGAIFLGEVVDARLIIGSILILGGIFVVNTQPKVILAFVRRGFKKKAPTPLS